MSSSNNSSVRFWRNRYRTIILAFERNEFLKHLGIVRVIPMLRAGIIFDGIHKEIAEGTVEEF